MERHVIIRMTCSVLAMALVVGFTTVLPARGGAVEMSLAATEHVLRSDTLGGARRTLFDEPELFAFEASIDLATGALSALRGVPAGSALSEDPGLLFEPGTSAEISADGMRIQGTGRALINHPDIPAGELTAVYSSDFLIGGDPLGIEAGRVEFQRGFQILAYADVNGFHLSDEVEETPPLVDLLADLPDRLPLPDERLAYLLIRRGTDLLVDGTLNDDGSLTLVGNANQPELYMPPLGGVIGLEADVPSLTIDPVTLVVLDGQVRVDRAIDDPIYDFGPGWDVPFLLTAIDYTAVEGGLHFSGYFKVLGGTVPETPLRYVVPPDGFLDATLSRDGLAGGAPLVEGSDRVVLRLHRLDAGLSLPLLTGGLSTYSLLLDATYRIQQDGALAAGADVTLDLDPTGLSVATFTALPDDDTVPLRLDELALDLSGIDHLGVVFQPDGSQTLCARLSAYFGSTRMPALAVPLDHVALDPSGFYVPAQTLEQPPPSAGASLYDLVDPVVPAFRHGPLDLYLLAFRLPETRFDWFAWAPGEDPGIDPALDFEARLHGFAGKATGLAEAQLTLQDAHFDGGLLQGSILPYTLTGGVTVPLDQVAFDVTQISGSLARQADDTQAFDVHFRGNLTDSALFEAGAGASCTGSIEVRLAQDDGLAGTIADYTPCGIVPFAPFELTYSGADLAFAYDGTTQGVVLDGSVSAVFDHQDFTGGTGTGTLALDLAGGTVREVDLTMQDFGWTYPRIAPLFEFQVEQADVVPEGLVFVGDGTVATGASAADVSYNSLRVPFAESAIEAGSVDLQEAFAFDVTLPGMGWALAAGATLPADDTHRVRFTVPAGQRLDANGMTIASASGTGAFRTQSQSDSGLDVAYADFHLTFQPAQVVGGTADLNQGSTRVAWFDRDGFHLESGPAFTYLPDILPLGSEQIAYLRLRDAAGDPYVEMEVLDDGNRRLFTRPDEPAPVVFAGLGGAEGRLAYDIVVNESFAFASDLATTPLADSAAVAGTPLQIDSLTFTRTDGLDLSLVASLNDVVPGLDVPFRARAGANGFADARVVAGAVTESGKHSATLDAYDPLRLVHFDDPVHNIGEAVTVLARGGTFEYTSGTYTIIGDITSKAFGPVPVAPDATNCPYGAPERKTAAQVKFFEWEAQATGDATTNTCREVIHYTATWTGSAWDVDLDVDPAGGTLTLGKKGTFTYDATDGVHLVTGPGFALDLKGTLGLPGLSVGIDVAVSKLHLGADSLYGTAEGVDQQQMEFMKSLLILRPEKETIRLTVDEEAAFTIRFDGDMLLNVVKAERQPNGDWNYLPSRTEPHPLTNMKGRDLTRAKFANASYSCANAQMTVTGPTGTTTAPGSQVQAMVFEDLRLDTNGRLEFGEGEYNLLAKYEPISIIKDKLCVHWLGLGMKDSQITGAQVPYLRLGVVADVPNMKKKGSVSRNDRGIGIGEARAPATERDGSKVQMTGLAQIGFADASFAFDMYGVFDSGTQTLVTNTEQAAYFQDRAAYTTTYDPKINGSPAEVSLFDKAVLEVTGLGLEMDFEKVDFRVRAALALHIYGKKDERAAAANTSGSRGISATRLDPEGRPYKTITFADPRKLQAGDGLWFRYFRGDYGAFDEGTDSTEVSTGGVEEDGTFFSVSADDVGTFSFGWSLFAESGSGLFDVDLDLVSLTLTRLQIDPEDVWFSMDGRATVRHPTVQGMFGYKGFTAGLDTLNVGRPQGPFILNIDKYMALEVGCVEIGYRGIYGEPLTMTRKVAKATSRGLIALADTTITGLDTYFKFTSCLNEGDNPAATGRTYNRALRLAIFTGANADSRWTSATPSGDAQRGPVTIGAQRGDAADTWQSARPSDLEGVKDDPSLLFSGSIRQVVYYKKTNGDIYFDLDVVDIEVGKSDAFKASIVGDITVETDSAGFGVDFSGTGKLGLGGKKPGTDEYRDNYAFAAVGKFSTLKGELSMGLFLAASGFTVPIVPGVVELTGVGGGFFWRPGNDDLDRVYLALKEMTGGVFRSQHPNCYRDVFAGSSCLPKSKDLTFAVMLYAQAGLGGSKASGYAAEAYTLVSVTDQFFNLDMVGKIPIGEDLKLADSQIGQSFSDMEARPAENEPRLKFGAYLNVKWQEHVRGVMGGAGIYYVEYAEVGDLASATGRVDFSFLSKAKADGGGYWDGNPNTRPQNLEYEFVWALTGHVDVRFFAQPGNPTVQPLFLASADLLVCNRGFLFNIHAEFNKVIADLIALRAAADVDFWWNDPRQELGIFARLNAGVDVGGGLIASAQVAFQVGLLWEAAKGDFVFFGAGQASVKVLGVFDGEVAGWFAITSTGAEAGLGTNAEYEQRIAASRKLMEEMKKEAEAVIQAINDPATSLRPYSVSVSEAQAAGRALIREGTAARRQAVDDILGNEQRLASFRTQHEFDYVAHRVFNQRTSSDGKEMVMPTGFGEEAEALNSAVDRIRSRAAALRERFDAIHFEFDEAEAAAASLDAFPNPVRRTGNDFAVDQQTVEAQRRQFTDFRAAVEQDRQQYAEVLLALESKMTAIDSLLFDADNSLTAYSQDFVEAFEKNGALLQGKVRNQSEARLWAIAGQQWLATQKPALEDILHDINNGLDPRYRDGSAVSVRHTNEDAYTRTRPPSEPGWRVLDGYHRLALLAANRAAFITDLQDGTYDGTNQPVTVICDGSERWLRSTSEPYRLYTAFDDWQSFLDDAGLGCALTLSSSADGILRELWMLRGLAYENGLNLWYTMPREALRALQSDTYRSTWEFWAPFVDTLKSVIAPPWEAYTARLEHVYARKSALTETLAGMFGAYADWAEAYVDSADADPLAARARAEQQALLEDLRPPRLTGFQVEEITIFEPDDRAFWQRAFDDFNYGTPASATYPADAAARWPLTRARLAWETSGSEMAEASVQFFAPWDYCCIKGSLGGRTSLTMYFMESTGDETELELSLSLAVRSRSGAQFKIQPYNLPEITIPLAHDGGDEETIAGEDLLPPGGDEPGGADPVIETVEAVAKEALSAFWINPSVVRLPVRIFASDSSSADLIADAASLIYRARLYDTDGNPLTGWQILEGDPFRYEPGAWRLATHLNLRPVDGADGFRVKFQVENNFGRTVESDFYAFWRMDYDISIDQHIVLEPSTHPPSRVGRVQIASPQVEPDYVEDGPVPVNWLKGDPASGRVGLPLTLTASDDAGQASDSLAFEYQLSSHEGGAWTSDWLPMEDPARYEQQPDPDTENGAQFTIGFSQDQPLTLHGVGDRRKVEITARARNPFGQTSASVWMGVFGLDAEPPSFDGPFEWIPPPPPQLPDPVLAVTNDPVAVEANTQVPATPEPPARPLVAFRRPAVDDEGAGLNGLDPYRVIYSTSGDVDEVLDEWLVTNAIAISRDAHAIGSYGPGAFDPWAYAGPYRDVAAVIGPDASEYYHVNSDAGTWEPFYIHLVAQDRVGHTTTRTFGPFHLPDPTRPQALEAFTQLGTQHLWLTRAAVDPESGSIAGYQLALGTTPGSDDLRAWPAGTATDFTDADVAIPLSTEEKRLLALGATLENLRPLDLEPYTAEIQGVDKIYVTVRAVNGQGLVSDMVCAGWVGPAVDESPPAMPAVSVVEAVTGDGYTGVVSNVYDQQSGVTMVRYRILSDGTTVQDWTTAWTNTFSSDGLLDPIWTSFGIEQTLLAPSWRLEVEVTNGAGLTTVRAVEGTRDPTNGALTIAP